MKNENVGNTSSGCDPIMLSRIDGFVESQDDESNTSAVPNWSPVLTSDSNSIPSTIPLIPVVMDYAWGIRGMDSRVARYALESKTLSEVDSDTPYAELWIGTHPSGPSMLENRMSLQEAVGEELPFLFKVLSAGKALSIQAHPDKEGAKRLHQQNPAAYGDANHKPEMAIALTPFEAMCGFRRLEEIAVLLKKHPEFAACISEEAKLAVFLSSGEESQQKALRKLFASFMSCPREVSERNLKLLLIRLQAEQSQLHPHPHDEPAWERKSARAILRLAQQFPDDPGAMAPLFLNYLLMAPGESFFMAANEPHAYVAGEIIECMACSDNVVRAGLTPKFKDVDNLVDMLTYTMGGPSIDAGAPSAHEPRILRYTPPTPEFEVLIITVGPGEDLLMANPGVHSVMIVLEGNGQMDGAQLQPGRSYYWPADAPALHFKVAEFRRGPLKVAFAHKNLNIDRPTAVNREIAISRPESRGVSVPSSPLPYLGLPCTLNNLAYFPSPPNLLKKTNIMP